MQEHWLRYLRIPQVLQHPNLWRIRVEFVKTVLPFLQYSLRPDIKSFSSLQIDFSSLQIDFSSLQIGIHLVQYVMLAIQLIQIWTARPLASFGNQPEENPSVKMTFRIYAYIFTYKGSGLDG